MRRKTENHMVQLTKDDLVVLMDMENLFDEFGNPIAIRGDNGVEWILMSTKYYERMQGENRDYEAMLDRYGAIDLSRKQGPCEAE